MLYLICTSGTNIGETILLAKLISGTEVSNKELKLKMALALRLFYYALQCSISQKTKKTLNTIVLSSLHFITTSGEIYSYNSNIINCFNHNWQTSRILINRQQYKGSFLSYKNLFDRICSHMLLNPHIKLLASCPLLQIIPKYLKIIALPDTVKYIGPDGGGLAVVRTWWPSITWPCQTGKDFSLIINITDSPFLSILYGTGWCQGSVNSPLPPACRAGVIT